MGSSCGLGSVAASFAGIIWPSRTTTTTTLLTFLGSSVGNSISRPHSTCGPQCRGVSHCPALCVHMSGHTPVSLCRNTRHACFLLYVFKIKSSWIHTNVSSLNRGLLLMEHLLNLFGDNVCVWISSFPHAESLFLGFSFEQSQKKYMCWRMSCTCCHVLLCPVYTHTHPQ